MSCNPSQAVKKTHDMMAAYDNKIGFYMLYNTAEHNIPLEQHYQITIAALTEENSVLKAEVDQLTQEINRLKEQLKLSTQRQFGKKSELGEPIASDSNAPLTHVKAHTRKKKTRGRLIDVSTLPRHTIHHDLAEHEKVCSCCHAPLKQVGKDTSEQIEVLPQRLYVAKHVRYKYACRSCDKMYMSPKEKSPIPKSMAGGSLLAEIITGKYHYQLPLYRQSKMLASYHAEIPDNTLSNWVIQTGEGLMPIYEAFWKAILGTTYLQVDETPVKILNPEKKGYLWSYVAPHIGKGLVIFELSLTRSAAVVEERLSGYSGILQTDGYTGYQGLRKRAGIVGVGCLTHMRRKFADVLKISKNPEGCAARVIEHLKPLYALETRMREAQCDFRTRKRLRQRLALPILRKIKRDLQQDAKTVLPKSQLGLAIQYAFNQWQSILQYCHHGQAEIDTNWVENKIRIVAVGRKNWLFMGNQDSGTVHALFYSLVSSSIANGLNPRIYLHYLIMQIHNLRQGKVDPAQLLPHTIDRDLLQNFAQEQVDKAKYLLNTG